MNRFEYCNSKLFANEVVVAKEKCTKFYNGNAKTRFYDGDLVLTTHRLFWGSHEEFYKGSVQLCLNLKYIKSVTEESSSYIFTKKRRIICNLIPVELNKLSGPLDNMNCSIDFIKISSKAGLSEDFIKAFRSTVDGKMWTTVVKADEDTQIKKITLRTGIIGIERSIISKQLETDKNISKAFKDLDVLMNMAQDMVKISKVIGGKIKDRNSEISEDETIKFKKYLMSLGLEDPVTRNNFQTDSEYFRNLAKEITEVLLDVVGESDGMITLPEAYCRINRARCLEMLATKDFLFACKYLKGPLELRTFQSGTVILTLEPNKDSTIADCIEKKMMGNEYLTIEKYADEDNISLLLAKERLLVAEALGKICRDKSIQGLRFYQNKFLT